MTIAQARAWVGLVATVSLLAALGFAGAATPPAAQDMEPVQPAAAEAPAAAYVDPANRFQITVPAGWEVAASAGGPALYLVKANENVAISLGSEPWCGASPADAVSLLASQVVPYRFTGIQILDPPASLSLNGQVAATAFFRHSLAEGPALQKRAVILAPEWSLAWTFAGAMGNASATALSDTINVTLGTFYVLPGPTPASVTHPAAHLSVMVPPGWTSKLNVTVGTETVDVLLTHPDFTGTIALASEARTLSGTPAEARQILQDAVDQLAAEPGFRILEPMTDTSVDAHPAASVALQYQPSTYDLVQTLTVVVGSEWSRDWAIIGTMYSWEALGTRTCVNATLASLTIEAAPPGQAFVGVLTSHAGWILFGALVATATEGTALGILVVRQSRRERR